MLTCPSLHYIWIALGEKRQASSDFYLYNRNKLSFFFFEQHPLYIDLPSDQLYWRASEY